MDPTTKNGAHELRALINNLLRARLDWHEATKPARKPGSVCIKRHAYAVYYDGAAYTVAKSSKHIRLYRIGDDKKSELIASTSSSEVSAELVVLYRHARNSFYSWTNAEIARCYRQELKRLVPVRELFALADHQRLADDYADEMAFIALSDRKIITEQEISAYHHDMRTRALQAISSISACSQTSDSVLEVVESGASPMSWRVNLPTSFPAGKTDLHVRICPTYHVEDANGDLNRETAVNIAALLILLSL